MKRPAVFTIPAGADFARALARGLLDRLGGDTLKLSSAMIYLPTQRATRSFGEAFADAAGGATLLPQFKADGHRKDVGPSWGSGGEAAASEAERKTIVRNCIEKLPDDYRNIILLRDIEEIDTRAVAELLEISESLVKTRLHRARQALRTLLDPFFQET